MIPDWLYISQTAGTSGTTVITVSAGTNNSEFYKSGKIEVSNKYLSEDVYIVENSMYILVSPSSITQTYISASKTINVSANTNCFITYPDWVSGPSTGSGNFSISVSISQNTDNVVRTGNIVFTNNSGITAEVIVTQYPNYNDCYLSFEILYGGNIYWWSESSSNTKTIEYSKDGGSTWTSITSSTAGTPISVSKGENVIFRGNNTRYYENTYRTAFRTDLGNTKAAFNIYGNILSLNYGDDFSNYNTVDDTEGNTYRGLFFPCYGIVDASRLYLLRGTPPTSCCNSMFRGCTGMTAMPSLTNCGVSSGCYANAFYDCWNLTAATTTNEMEYSCFSSAWENCYGLEEAFIGVYDTLTLPERSFHRAFYECKNLRFIDASTVQDHSASNCTYNWVFGVKSSGRFWKKSGVSWSTGVSGIPSGWTTN